MKHVHDAAQCEVQNQITRGMVGGRDIEFYSFNQEACACLINHDVLDEPLHPELILDFFFEGAVISPFSTGDFFFQCQIDEIYNHGLGPDCSKEAEDLAYNYTDTLKSNELTREGLPERPGYIQED